MWGRLWGSLAVVFVCFLVIVRADTDQKESWDKGQLESQRPSAPSLGHWRAYGPEVKLNSGDDGSPAETREGTVVTHTTTPTAMATTTTITTIIPTNTNIPTMTTTPTTMTEPTTTTGTTTTTPTTTTTTTTSPGPCQNGATWDGIKCLCPSGFYGEFCEIPICQNGGTWANGFCECTENFQGAECQFAKEIIEIKNVTVNATVEMKTKIENRIFTELSNKSSPAFKEFETEFKKRMREVYKDIEGYQDVVIHELTQGSVVVNYTVLLEVPASSTANKTVETISKSLVSAVSNYTGCNDTCQGNNCTFCFNPSFTNVTNYGVEEVKTSLCDGYTPEGFESYYTAVTTTAGVVCVTQCDKRSPDSYPCVHGMCSVTRSGPQCDCSEPSAFWYQDSACSSRISKVGVAIGAAVTVLVVAVIIFTIFMVWAQRQKGKDRDKLSSRTNLYYDLYEDSSVYEKPPRMAAANNKTFYA